MYVCMHACVCVCVCVCTLCVHVCVCVCVCVFTHICVCISIYWCRYESFELFELPYDMYECACWYLVPQTQNTLTSTRQTQ